MQSYYPVLATLAAYLIGSLSFAVIVSRAMGLKDPRTYGSHNPGATNVLRSGNRAAAILTLLLDALKGYLPVVLVVVYGERWGLGEGSGRAGRSGGVSRPSVAGVLPLSPAARAWPPRPACCSASIRGSASRPC